MNTNKPEALIKEQDNSDTDYILNPDYPSCWITVDNVSVYIQRTDEGVIVDLYAKGQECGELLTSTYASFEEAKANE
jgi:hypothetical protein